MLTLPWVISAAAVYEVIGCCLCIRKLLNGLITMYEGVTLDKIPMPEDVATPLELIRIDSDRKILLNTQCVEILDVKQGDIVLISAMSEGFYVTKFTEKDIISFL